MQSEKFRCNWGMRLAIASLQSVLLQRLIGLGLGLLVAPTILPVHAAALIGWRFNPTTVELELTVPAGVTPEYFLLAEPARIVVDLPNTDLGSVALQQAYTGSVRHIRVNQFEPGLTRIVLELSPGAEFAAGQVQLERMGQASTAQGDRWILRPLLASSTPASSSPPQPTAAAPASTPIAPSIPLATIDPSVVDESISTTNLPPLEPGALEIPVQAPAEIESRPVQPTADILSDPEEMEPAGTAIPLATATADRLEGSAEVGRISQPEILRESSIAVIEFGESLPTQASLPSSQAEAETGDPDIVVRTPGNVLIPVGTVLPLRYPGTQPLRLDPDQPWQEVLLLNQAVRDRSGTLIAPMGSQVIGQFELTRDGSSFTAHAIVLEGRNVRLDASTIAIEPRSNSIQPNQVIEAQVLDDARRAE